MESLNSSTRIAIGVIVQWERIDHPWQDYRWRAVAVTLGEAESPGWREIEGDVDRRTYFAGKLTLELHRKETAAYIANLESEQPSVYVVMQEGEGTDANPIELHLATVSAFEAQDYLDSGEDLVEVIPMPEPIRAWVENYIARHHVEEKFIKRKQKPAISQTPQFGQEPIFDRRVRARRECGNDQD